jgi:phage tail sheath protein FI
MPTFTTPGVYIEEVATTAAIQPVATAVTLFIGLIAGETAPSDPPPLHTFAAFEQKYGTATQLRIGRTRIPNYLADAARAFFGEGGTTLHVIGIGTNGGMPGAADWDKAFARAAKLDANIAAAPGLTTLPIDGPSIDDRLLALAAPNDHRMFVLLDPPPGLDLAGIQALRASYGSVANAALYYPWLNVAAGQKLKSTRLVPPSGFMAGIYARSDMDRGVWKAPANQDVRSAVSPERAIDDAGQNILNPLGINCIRTFAGRGIRVWGARTLSRDPEWTYVSVRRFATFVEQSLASGLGWTVFEPNSPALWARITGITQAFLTLQWRTGALMGTKPDEAFYVRCDRTTMSQADIDAGRILLEIGLAVIKPAEFVVLRIEAQANAAGAP